MAQVNYRVISGPVFNIGELRTVGQDKKSVIDFTVAYSVRFLDGDTWKNGPTEWVRVTAWRKLAENFKESVREKDRVIVSGQVKVKEGFTGKDGREFPASSYIEADDIGLSLNWDTASSNREDRGEGTSRSSSNSSSSSTSTRTSKPTEAPKKTTVEADDLDLDFLDDDDDDFA